MKYKKMLAKAFSQIEDQGGEDRSVKVSDKNKYVNVRPLSGKTYLEMIQLDEPMMEEEFDELINGVWGGKKKWRSGLWEKMLTLFNMPLTKGFVMKRQYSIKEGKEETLAALWSHEGKDYVQIQDTYENLKEISKRLGKYLD